MAKKTTKRAKKALGPFEEVTAVMKWLKLTKTGDGSGSGTPNSHDETVFFQAGSSYGHFSLTDRDDDGRTAFDWLRTIVNSIEAGTPVTFAIEVNDVTSRLYTYSTTWQIADFSSPPNSIGSPLRTPKHRKSSGFR